MKKQSVDSAPGNQHRAEIAGARVFSPELHASVENQPIERHRHLKCQDSGGQPVEGFHFRLMVVCSCSRFPWLVGACRAIDCAAVSSDDFEAIIRSWQAGGYM